MKRKLLLSIILSVVLLLAACTDNTPAANTDNVSETENATVNETSDDVTETNEEIVIGTIQFAHHVALDRAREGFLEALDEAGINYREEYVNVQGDVSISTTSAQKMLADDVDVIHAIATPAAQAAKNVISDIPIIFSAVTDPVAAELVEDKSAPEANVTGATDYFSSEVQLQNFIKIFPDINTIGVLYSTDEANSQVQIEELKEFAAELGIDVEVVGVSSINDVPQAMNSLVTKIDGYFAITDNLASNAASVIGNILVEEQIPSFSAEEGPVENGLLYTDGVNYKDLGKQAGLMAVQILQEGKDPSEIPVVDPTVTKKVVNKEVADKLGIDSTSEIFTDAEVIE